MTKVKILKTTQGSPDGIQVLTYHEGNEYDLNDSLVAAFIQMGVVEVVIEEEKPQEPIAAPENAAFVSAPETKPNKKGKK